MHKAMRPKARDSTGAIHTPSERPTGGSTELATDQAGRVAPC